MARIVLVHGIAQEKRTGAELEAAWLPALADGVRGAGFGDVAALLCDDTRPVDARMAFYGDVFAAPDVQGNGDELLDDTGIDVEFLEALAEEWLRRAAEDAGREPDRELARRELSALVPVGETQGARAALRPVINALSRLRPFARFGVSMAERTVVRALRQVTRYLTEEDVRARVQARVAQHLGPETQLVIGHSLGSVVAYEAVHASGRPLPLLVTMGSPLGLRSIVYDRTRPQPPSVPPGLLRWVNVADRDDLVAARPDLRPLFPGADGVLEAGLLVDNGAKPHEATFYLRAPEIGLPVGRVLG